MLSLWAKLNKTVKCGINRAIIQAQCLVGNLTCFLSNYFYEPFSRIESKKGMWITTEFCFVHYYKLTYLQPHFILRWPIFEKPLHLIKLHRSLRVCSNFFLSCPRFPLCQLLPVLVPVPTTFFMQSSDLFLRHVYQFYGSISLSIATKFSVQRFGGKAVFNF